MVIFPYLSVTCGWKVVVDQRQAKWDSEKVVVFIGKPLMWVYISQTWCTHKIDVFHEPY